MRADRDSSFPGTPQPGPGMPPAPGPPLGGSPPGLGSLDVEHRGKLCRQAGRDQRVAGNRLDQLTRQCGLAPRDPALPIDLDQLRVRTRPDKDQALLARLDQAPSRELGQGSHGLTLFPAHEVGPHPAVGAGVRGRSHPWHEMDWPRARPVGVYETPRRRPVREGPRAQARVAPPASRPRKRASRLRRSDRGPAVQSFLESVHLQVQSPPQSRRGLRRPDSGLTTDRSAPSRGHPPCVGPRPQPGRPGSPAPGYWRCPPSRAITRDQARRIAGSLWFVLMFLAFLLP